MVSKLSEATLAYLTAQTRANLEILAMHIESGGAYPEGEKQAMREAHKVYQAAKPPVKAQPPEED